MKIGRIREKFLKEILDMYTKGEISAGIASQILGVPRAVFFNLLAETNTPLPEKLMTALKKRLRSH